MFVNPWTYYIVNDEMPDTSTVGLGDKFRNRVLWSLVYAFAVLFLWGTVVVLGSKYLIGYGSEHFMLKFCLLIFPSLALMVFLLIFGMNKILDVNEKEKVTENNMKEENAMKMADYCTHNIDGSHCELCYTICDGTACADYDCCDKEMD